MSSDARLRELPSVEEVSVHIAELHPHLPRAVVVAEVRAAIAEARREILAGGEPNSGIEVNVPELVERLAQLQRPSLRRVINATGVVLHTNLGRAPLPHYLNLEYDLATGRRGKRDVHVASLIERVTGAPGIVVNNNAAAVFLVLNELAAGHEVIVSRGELIEIGDGFRIPDIMQRSGAVVREVGTTNRTRIEDYAAAIGDRTRLLLRVHPSNFRISGFTARPELGDLVALGRERGIPVYEDLGSGCVADLKRFGVEEPLVGTSIRAGASVVSFSGDKLLGGPQAGIIAGDAALVQRIRRNPLFRALRVDKLVYAALETTLRNIALERWDQIPALRMIAQSADEIRSRAERLLGEIVGAELIPGSSVIGGGSTPDQSIPTWLIALTLANASEAERRCRAQDPPVIGRIEDDRLVFDLRTVLPEDEAEFVAAVRALAS
ncbi:MAG: L-seryl-tRNA(Sec) selenium transferase [Bryobacteraceae bacterium]